MKLGWMLLSFPFLIHACIEEARVGFWKGGWAKNKATSYLGLQEE